MRVNFWIQLLAGLWILISPWVLGFYAINLALWSNLIAGVLIIILNIWSLIGESQE